jgi:hypothetical protein
VKRLVAAVLLLCAGAQAHQAPAGWDYAKECCSDTDCAPVPEGAIREAPGGWSVTIEPGTHPMVPKGAVPLVTFIPHGDARVRISGDEHRHACVGVSGWIYCIYVQFGGM